MSGDAKDWTDEAIRIAEKAKEKGISILLRNDEENIIVSNASSADFIRALGEALSCGYEYHEEE